MMTCDILLPPSKNKRQRSLFAVTISKGQHKRKKIPCFQFLSHCAKSFRRLCADLSRCLYRVAACEFWRAVPILLFFTNPHKYFAWKYFIQSLFSFCNSDCSLRSRHWALCWLCRWLRHSIFLKELRSPWGKQTGTLIITIPWCEYFDKDMELAHIAYCLGQWEDLKSSLTMRMCSGRQATEEPEEPWSAIVFRATLLSKGGRSSYISHSHGADKNGCCIPRGRIQDSEAPVWEKSGRGPENARQQEWDKSLPEAGEFLRI